MAKEKRFVKTYFQDSFADNSMEVWVDSVTGVNYLFSQSSNAGGLTVLLDAQGNPVVTPLPRAYSEQK